MARRSVASGVVSFGLVSIPVKFYVAAQAKGVSFCQLTENGKRVKQCLKEEGTGREVSRGELKKGYEVSKGRYISFEPSEIKALEETSNGSIEIKEFVPANTVDLLHVEKSYHLGPNKGGDKAYNLLSQAMKKTGKYAIAQWSNRGKQHLVVLRPYQDGIVIHQMFYADEVREFETDAAKTTASEAEVDMACMLIESNSKESYDVEQYSDSFRTKVEKAIEQRASGEELTITPDAPSNDGCGDIMAALIASLAKAS